MRAWAHVCACVLMCAGGHSYVRRWGGIDWGYIVGPIVHASSIMKLEAAVAEPEAGGTIAQRDESVEHEGNMEQLRPIPTAPTPMG